MDSPTTSMTSEDRTLRIFHYIPNLPLAVVSMIVYLIFAIYISYQVYKKKSARYLYILPITAAMEVLGYLLRIMCHSNTTVGKYAIMQILLLLPPNALALVNYKTVGEMIRVSNVPEKRFYLKHRFVSRYFFASDILAFFIQGGGSSLTAINQTTAKYGSPIVVVGLCIQVVFLTCFAGVNTYVCSSSKYQVHVSGVQNPKRKLAICMSVTLFFLYVRSFYRVIEYATGYDGPVASAEWAFYVFDTLAIAIAFVFYALYHIGDYLPKENAGDEQAVSLNPLQKSEQYQRV